jgi:hypothetical protein
MCNFDDVIYIYNFIVISLENTKTIPPPHTHTHFNHAIIKGENGQVFYILSRT